MAKKRIPQGIIGYGSSLDQFSFERLATLPSTNNFGGRLVQLTTDGLIYKRNEANSAWDVIGSPTGVIKADGTVPFTANQSMGGNQLTNVGFPVNPYDAATNIQISGLKKYFGKVSVVYNGTTDPSAFVPGNTIDGYTLLIGDLILAINTSNSNQRWIYSVEEFETFLVYDAKDISSRIITVENGTVYKNTYWVNKNIPTDIAGTSNGLWEQFYLSNINPIQRANHTGTQPSSTISDFNTAVDARVALGTVGLFDYRGNYDASVGTFPTTGGSGSAGAILKGDVFRISVAGTMGGVAYKIGDHALALVDSPAQTASNWGSWINDEGSGSLVAKSTPTLIGNGSLTVIPVTHNLGTKNVKAIVRKVSDDTIWDIDPTATSTNIANLDFGAYVPTTNEFEVVIIA